MRVKKFEAKSMKEALHMVKKELGPDAVILSARDNRKSFGIGGEASVEITAAVSESTLQKKKYVESRMTQSDREKFANSDARTQRTIIEKMVDRRMREQQQQAQAEAAKVPRPITRTSYIDIEDEEIEVPTHRRVQAFERAKGRNVSDLLNDFDQDFEDIQPQRAQPRVAQQQQQRFAQETRQPQYQEPARRQAMTPGDEEEQRSTNALSRIRNAAREAWKNSAFIEEEEKPARTTSARPSQSRSQAQMQQAQAQQRPAGQDPRTQQFDRDVQAPAYARNATAPVLSNQSDLKSRIAQAKAQVGAPQAQPQAPSRMQAEAPRVAQGGLEMHEEAPLEAQFEVPPQSTAEIVSLKGEIQRLHKMLEGFQKVPQTFQQSFASMHPGAEHGVPYDLSPMYQKLSEAGVSTENILEILQSASKEIDPQQAKKRPIVDAWVARWFLNKMQIAQSPWNGRLHLFVGGSGSGKTSSLVKMAAHLVVKEKKKVAILSTDALKVGAVDQMKIYCQILNVPFAVVRNRQDWEWVLGQLRRVDHVLVDFPGLQLRDLEEIHYLKSLLPPEGHAPVTHLCVSATTKDGDAYEIASRYKVASPADLVFTNLDQSVQHGVIYNLHKRTGLPLHSFGIGHRIPEDFEPASKERVLDLIFKLTKLRRENV